MFKDFKEFITRGNVMSLAVGVIIGGAFGKIVSSLVADIITPIISILLGKVDLTEIVLEISGAKINIGIFLNNIIDFFVTAVAIFLFLKLLNHVKKIKIPVISDKLKPTIEEQIPESPPVKTTKECKFCCSEIAILAVRCPHCTSLLDY